MVFIAVAYKDINRTGAQDEYGLGYNLKSWSLECYTSSYKFRHNSIFTNISGPLSSRVGVYLNHKAGTPLHRVQTRFTQPLHPGFWLPNFSGDTAELCELKYE